MTTQKSDDRPPYVRFEVREVEDRDASLAAGGYKTKTIDYALITPVGGRECVERPTVEWLADLERVSRDRDGEAGRFPRPWYESFKSGYERWKAGQEIPLNGTPIKTWVVPSPQQSRALVNANILTVEDLAQANDEALQRVGMGAQDLKRRAKDWLEQAKSQGTVAAEIEKLKVSNDSLTKQVKALIETNDQLRAQVNGLSALPKVPVQVATASLGMAN